MCSVRGDIISSSGKEDVKMVKKVMSSKTAKAKRKSLKKEGKSGIVIKPQNKGTFTAAAKKSGKSVQGKAASVLADPNASPAMKKKANFARNAAKWKKGGKKK
jgi:hypothetical protein